MGASEPKNWKIWAAYLAGAASIVLLYMFASGEIG